MKLDYVPPNHFAQEEKYSCFYFRLWLWECQGFFAEFLSENFRGGGWKTGNEKVGNLVRKMSKFGEWGRRIEKVVRK